MFSGLFNKKLLTDRQKLGNWGEKKAEKFLKKKGLKLLARNFSYKTGEIDLIMVDSDRSIVFVEVRTRAKEDFVNTEETVNFTKRKKIKKTARIFLAENQIEDRPFRFDVVTVIANNSKYPVINYFESAFR